MKRKTKKKSSNKVLDLVIRYLILIVVAFPGLWLFYSILTPITVHLVYYLTTLFYDANMSGTLISLGKVEIRIIEACVAGAAYYLLLILNMSVPGIKIKKRIKMIAVAFGTLLILNVLRILLMTFLIGSDYFDITHKVFWYLGSVVLVIGIWFAEVKYFKIKDIPFYSDMKFLFKKSVIKRK